MNRKTAFAMVSAALMMCGAFVCCSFISDDSEAAFSYHESTRGMMTNHSAHNATTGSAKVFGTILNPYTRVNVNLNNFSGTNIVYVETGSQIRIATGTTSHFHNKMISTGWSYSDGVYTCVATSGFNNGTMESSVYLNGNSILLRSVANPGFLNDNEYWYCGTSASEPLLGINITNIADLMLMDANDVIYIAVGASVYIGPYQGEGEQWMGGNSIGLSQAGYGSISGTISGVGTASFRLSTPYDGEDTTTISAVSYSELVPITASDMVVIQNNALTFTPVPAGNTVSISGAPWLSVNGNVVSGTPTVIGDYTVTITCGESTKTITIKVISELTVTNSPANGIVVMPS